MNKDNKTATHDMLMDTMGISEKVIKLVEGAQSSVGRLFSDLDDTMEYNQYKVLKAFQDNRVSDIHFAWATGYGYNDLGRETLEKVYAQIFGGEAALVRPIIVNGTHALTLTLSGMLRPGQELVYCSGTPYDTLEEVIGIRGEGKGSLADFGIKYNQIELLRDGALNLDAVTSAINENTAVMTVQRATGYGWRKAINIHDIERWVQTVKSVNPNIICMVDNCYGEFLDTKEPCEVGADVVAGSLIKNPGGGIVLSGGYIVGRKDLIEKISYRMTSPGIGGECGLTFGQTRTMLQGLFIAPKTVNGAVKGAILCGQTFNSLGFDVCPKPQDPRSDIIQAIKLGTPERVTAFCEGIQAAAPIDAHVTPVPWNMPGYEDPVIMAAGAFIQGSSIELSADAPIRPPYIVYYQGGLTYEHAKIGVIQALEHLYRKNLINITGKAE